MDEEKMGNTEEEGFLSTQQTDADMYDWCRRLEKEALEELGETERLEEIEKQDRFRRK